MGTPDPGPLAVRLLVVVVLPLVVINVAHGVWLTAVTGVAIVAAVVLVALVRPPWR